MLRVGLILWSAHTTLSCLVTGVGHPFPLFCPVKRIITIKLSKIKLKSKGRAAIVVSGLDTDRVNVISIVTFDWQMEARSLSPRLPQNLLFRPRARLQFQVHLRRPHSLDKNFLASVLYPVFTGHFTEIVP